MSTNKVLNPKGRLKSNVVFLYKTHNKGRNPSATLQLFVSTLGYDALWEVSGDLSDLNLVLLYPFSEKKQDEGEITKKGAVLEEGNVDILKRAILSKQLLLLF